MVKEDENAKQQGVFKTERPLSIPVKIVNYKSAFEFKMNKNKTTNSNDLETSKE